MMLAADVGAGLGLAIDLRGETGEELVNIKVGDYSLGVRSLTTEWRRFEFDNIRDSSLTANDIQVEFQNDVYDPATGFDRNVFVGSLFLNGEAIDPNGPDSFSTGTWLPDDGIVSGSGRGSVLNANGYLQFGNPEGSVLTVFARGEQGDETMRVRAGSEDFLSMTVTTELQAYNFFLNETVDPGSVRIEFNNDLYLPDEGIDRNLAVDRIELDGVTYQAESPDVLHAGFFDGSGLATGFFFTETIQGNGFFQFDALNPDSPRYAFDQDVSDDGLIVLSQGNFAFADSFSDGGFVGIGQPFGFGPPTITPVVVEAFDGGGNVDATFNGGSPLDLLPTLQTSFEGDLQSVSADGVLLDSQDRIVVPISVFGQNPAGDFVAADWVLRLNRSGNIDTSYGTDGIYKLDEPAPSRIQAVALDPVDRVLLAGESQIVRLTSDGQLDTGFGSGGIATFNTPQSDINISQVQARSDRSIVVLAERSFVNEGDNGYAIQFNEDGSLGTWFGDNGIATIPRQFFSSNSFFAEKYREFTIDDQERLVLRSQRSVLRLTVNGQVDLSFGDHGVAKLPQDLISDAALIEFGSESGPVIDSSGGIVVALNNAFARFDQSGQLDTSFSADGIGVAPDVGEISFDVSGLQIDVFGRLFSPIRTRTQGPAIAVWESV